ncbi:MAG: tyrosine-protein phosphatase [Defluviitaleaceae bacterium]|nr:tyrosine-protein phosphatase [Defluviitaleaceae bacterium]
MNKPENFRDLGGIVGHNGKKIKPKRLLRSAALTVPMPPGYDLKQIIDLRSEKEAKKSPDIVPNGVSYIRADILMDGSVKGASIGSLVFRGKVAACDTYLMNVYTGFVTSEAARTGFATLINACANNPLGATLFHCVAGKDRTGFGAALLLKILGASDADIIADYMQTEKDRYLANKAFIARYSRRGLFFKKQQEALAVIMGVRPEYLLASFDAMDNIYDNFDEYLSQGLGVTPQTVQLLRKGYLES